MSSDQTEPTNEQTQEEDLFVFDDPALDVRTSFASEGLGLYTTRPVAAGQVIRRLRGRVLSAPTRESIRVGPGRHIHDAYGAFVNHSFEPTARVCFEREALVAARDLHAYTEITFDYNASEVDMAAPFCVGSKWVRGASLRRPREEAGEEEADNQEQEDGDGDATQPPLCCICDEAAHDGLADDLGIRLLHGKTHADLTSQLCLSCVRSLLVCECHCCLRDLRPTPKTTADDGSPSKVYTTHLNPRYWLTDVACMGCHALDCDAPDCHTEERAFLKADNKKG